ncbi:MAG: hypothetical protein JW893_01480 [Candidatus Omnitrophica bacterium]|nr:hypothetical protein [Candidatus Omnitrophota bacterium]
MPLKKDIKKIEKHSLPMEGKKLREDAMKVSRYLLVAILVLVMAGISGVTYAGSDAMLEKVTSDNYAIRAPYRAFQGVINAGLSWTQMFVEPINSVKYENQSGIDGFVDGFAKTLYYAVLGAWDMGTFWVPGQGGKDIAVKECVTQTFRRD